MPKMRGFLKTNEKIDEQAWELAQIRTAARLGDLFPSDDLAAGKNNGKAAPEADPAAAAAPIILGPAPWPGGARPPIIVIGVSEIVSVLGERNEIALTPDPTPTSAPALAETPAEVERVSPAKPIGQTRASGPIVTSGSNGSRPIGVMARPGDGVGRDPWQLPMAPGPIRVFAPPTAAHLFPPAPVSPPPTPSAPSTPREETPAEPPQAAVTFGDTPSRVRGPVELSAAEPVSASTTPGVVGPSSIPMFDAAPVKPPRKRPTGARTTVGRAAAGSTRAKAIAPVKSPAPRAKTRTSRARARVAPVGVPVVAAAYCPYCATRLDPPPTTNRRCDRCRQRVVVKRINGAAVYLTEAAVFIFEAQRERVRSSALWMRDRDRWLGHASAAGAPAERVRQLTTARLSDDVVGAARKLYVTTTDRAFRAARNDRRWDAAARLRREEAAVLHRLAGAPIPPAADVVAVFREGVAAELRGIAEISRDAELVSARCCEACRSDDRVIARISVELRAPRLPHAGCPKGLCHCRWDLAARDRLTLRRYLRRRAGPEPRPGHVES